MVKLPNIVEAVLNDYITLFNERMPNTLEGLYLHGSISLDAYVSDSSDIDFITMTNRRLSERDSESLSFIHKTIADKYKKTEMDGVYILREDVGKLYPCSEDENYNYPFYNSGKLGFGPYFNFNPITWTLFKNKGVTVIGPEPASFPIEIQQKQLFSYVLENMNTYWADRIKRMENSIEEVISQSVEEIDDEIEWSVLGLLRQYYTLKELDITSKLDAGEYGLLHIPVEWHDIIKEAINIRKGVKEEIFNSEAEKVGTILQFSKYLIGHCKSISFQI